MLISSKELSQLQNSKVLFCFSNRFWSKGVFVAAIKQICVQSSVSSVTDFRHIAELEAGVLCANFTQQNQTFGGTIKQIFFFKQSTNIIH
jgi:hypothetical protein